MTTAPELYQLTWPSLLAVAREADDMGLEARVSTFGFSLTCVDGAIIAYADFAGELQRLRDDVLPILEESGLRQPHRPVSAAAPS